MIAQHRFIACGALAVAALLAVVGPPTNANPPGEDVLRPVVPSSTSIYIEPYAGVNVMLLNGNEVIRPRISPIEGPTDMYNSAIGFAPRIGVNLGIQFTPDVALQFGLGYDGYRASTSGETEDTCLITDTGGNLISIERIDKDLTVGVDHVTVSMAGVFTLGPLLLDVGPAVGIPVNRSMRETWHVMDDQTSCRYFPETADTTRDVAGELADHIKGQMRGSLRIGLGTLIELENGMTLVPRIGFELGFTDLFKSDDAENPAEFIIRNEQGREGVTVATDINETMRANAIQITLGLRFM